MEILKAFLNRSFYCGYKKLPPATIKSRIASLENMGAKRVDDLDVTAYYLPAETEEKSKNIIVFALNCSYLQFPPKYYTYLKPKADVVLWDPVQFNPCQYKKDLESLVKKILKMNPEKSITIIGHCAAVDPMIGAAADLENDNVHLVLDRGYGNIIKFARTLSFFSRLSFIKKLLKEHFDCHGIEKINKVRGKILFIHSDSDQLTSWKGYDLQKELMEMRTMQRNDQIIELSPQLSDHWTPWDQDTYRKVHRFIGLKNLDISSFPKKHSSLSLFSRYIVPYLIHAWM